MTHFVVSVVLAKVRERAGSPSGGSETASDSEIGGAIAAHSAEMVEGAPSLCDNLRSSLIALPVPCTPSSHPLRVASEFHSGEHP